MLVKMFTVDFSKNLYYNEVVGAAFPPDKEAIFLRRPLRLLLYLAVFVLALALLSRSLFSSSDKETSDLSALSPYLDRLEAHGISPEDILSYTLKHSGNKITLNVTLRDTLAMPRIISISWKTDAL